jgi:hypothetical protein
MERNMRLRAVAWGTWSCLPQWGFAMTGPENTYANALVLSADAQWAVAAGQFSRSVTFSTSARLCVFLVSPCPFLPLRVRGVGRVGPSISNDCPGSGIGCIEERCWIRTIVGRLCTP